jgi:hypothetical protein
MARSEADSLLESVAATVRDYRAGEIRPVTPARVDRWLAQFPAPERPVLLQELDAVLKRLYFSRERVRDLLRRFLRGYVIGDGSPEAVLPHVSFLDIQTRGRSQRALLEIMDEILGEEYGTRLSQCGTAPVRSYVYLDDALYTGNRLRRDLTGDAGGDAPAWISREAPPGCSLLIYVTGCHAAGWRHAVNSIRREAARKEIQFRLYPGFVVDNERVSGGLAQCLWPRQLPDDPEVDRYVRQVRGELIAKGLPETSLLRDAGTPPEETLFSSPEARALVENAFLRAGARLALHSPRSPSLRPLGFEVLDTLGFGTLFVTYRNIANNCPLALWWSQPDVWHPLFPRRVNP